MSSARRRAEEKVGGCATCAAAAVAQSGGSPSSTSVRRIPPTPVSRQSRFTSRRVREAREQAKGKHHTELDGGRVGIAGGSFGS